MKISETKINFSYKNYCQIINKYFDSIIDFDDVNNKNNFVLMTSTPSVKDTSQIYEYWLKSDQRLPYTPCPHCEFEQFLNWENFSWTGKGDKHCTLSKNELLDSFHFI